jgi:hypothetical protein
MKTLFTKLSTLSVSDLEDKKLIEYEGNIEGRGMQYQALEVDRCVTAGLNESPTMSLDGTVQILKVMDLMRSLTGIEYSGAKSSW